MCLLSQSPLIKTNFSFQYIVYMYIYVWHILVHQLTLTDSFVNRYHLRIHEPKIAGVFVKRVIFTRNATSAKPSAAPPSLRMCKQLVEPFKRSEGDGALQKGTTALTYLLAHYAIRVLHWYYFINFLPIAPLVGIVVPSIDRLLLSCLLSSSL